ncbi:hypothetical protein SANTM175S_02044 [Streptomyces antimycoticus]
MEGRGHPTPATAHISHRSVSGDPHHLSEPGEHRPLHRLGLEFAAKLLAAVEG